MPSPGPGYEQRPVSQSPGTHTYCYPQDRRLHGRPFVLPSVYDQDESDASVLQAEAGTEMRVSTSRLTGVRASSEETSHAGKPGAASALHGEGRAKSASEQTAAFPCASSRQHAERALTERGTDPRCVLPHSQPHTGRLAAQRPWQTPLAGAATPSVPPQQPIMVLCGLTSRLRPPKQVLGSDATSVLASEVPACVHVIKCGIA